ncbi:MAG TPA: hypothetical protein ENJ82_05945 [Bacteroidetes bacterium]|nr:hypothetical protein [Bacteroidota bacterium]
MKRSIKKYLFASFLIGMLGLFLAPTVQAQKYRLAVGWRAGAITNGVTVKLVPFRGLALEGTLNVYPYGPSIGGMLISTKSVLCIEALQVYTGIGGHYRWAYASGRYLDPINGEFTAIAPPGNRGAGLDVVVGVELKIPLLPIAVSAELKPMLEVTDLGGMLYGLDPGLGVKLTF